MLPVLLLGTGLAAMMLKRSGPSAPVATTGEAPAVPVDRATLANLIAIQRESDAVDPSTVHAFQQASHNWGVALPTHGRLDLATAAQVSHHAGRPVQVTEVPFMRAGNPELAVLEARERFGFIFADGVCSEVL